MKGVKGEIDQRPRRFYRQASAEQTTDGWAVRLDGRTILTPLRRELIAPCGDLSRLCPPGGWSCPTMISVSVRAAPACSR